MLRRTTQKTLTERQRRIYDFLKNNRVGVLTSVGPNNEPHGVVVYFTIDGDFKVSFLTKRGTKKYDNLTRNNHTELVVFDPATQAVVQLLGVATEIKDSVQVNRIGADIFMTSLVTSEGGIPPIAKFEAGDYAAFEIEPKQIRMAMYNRPDSGDYDKIFESIESFELSTTA